MKLDARILYIKLQNRIEKSHLSYKSECVKYTEWRLCYQTEYDERKKQLLEQIHFISSATYVLIKNYSGKLQWKAADARLLL